MDHRKACERCDHEWCANPGGEVHQKASIIDVKKALMRELRGVEWLTVMPEESPVGASAGNAMIERIVWEMQSTTRAIVAYAEWVHGTVFGQCCFDVGCGVPRTGCQQVPKEVFRMGRQRMNAGS